MKYCTKNKKYHSECIGKEWILMESDGGSFRRSPLVKTFYCLAEARKGMITYIRNPDFQHLKFKLLNKGNQE